MSATDLKLRSPNFKSVKVTTPTAGYTAGQMVKIGELVGVIVETKTVGLEAVHIYQCEKIIVPKSTGCTFVIGAKVYFDATAAAVDSETSATTLCGRALAVGLTGDTTLEIELQGNLPA